MNTIQYVKGLEGVIAAESAICLIDGEGGHLYYRGYSIEDIVEHCSFEEVCYLLLYGELPDSVTFQRFVQKMRSLRGLNSSLLHLLKQSRKEHHPMEIMQAAILYMDLPDAEHEERDEAHSADDMLCLVAQFSSAIAALYRFRNGKEYVEPRSDLSHGANFLYMMHGTLYSEREGEIMDKCLTLHAEHSFNASTFTARVVASTLSTYHSSMSAAVGALFGNLHGGANERVVNALREIGSMENLDAWLENTFANNKKIPGFGHRVYKIKDPRSFAMERYMDDLAAIKQDTKQRNLLKALEEKTRKRLGDKPIYPNIDFFSGSVYQLMGIPSLYFTTVFAAARTIGWLAHIKEQLSNNRLFRPKAQYIGPKPRKLVR